MILWQWVIAAAGAIAGAGTWVVIYKHLPPQIPLFYSRPWGEEQLADTVFLWLPPGLALMTALIISLAVKKLIADRVLAAILTGAGIITEIILITAVLRSVILVS